MTQSRIPKINISEARKKMNSMFVRHDSVVIVTYHGRPVFAIVDVEKSDLLLDCVNIFSKRSDRKLLEEAIKKIKGK